MSTAATHDDRRFFTVSDGGADYTIVATSDEHAKQILVDAGIEFTTEDGDSAPVDAPSFADLRWIELSAETVAKITIDDDGVKRPLAECALGDWFSTEY